VVPVGHRSNRRRNRAANEEPARNRGTTGVPTTGDGGDSPERAIGATATPHPRGVEGSDPDRETDAASRAATATGAKGDATNRVVVGSGAKGGATNGAAAANRGGVTNPATVSAEREAVVAVADAIPRPATAAVVAAAAAAEPAAGTC
jgi:hypothetical protein